MEIQAAFHFLKHPLTSEVWHEFIADVEKILGCRLTHLDTKDPVRKKVVRLEDDVAQITDFGSEESSRRLFGKFGKSGIRLSISLFRGDSEFPNSVEFYIPDAFEGLAAEDIEKLFEKGISFLCPFYAYCDDSEAISSKRKASGFSVDLQEELIGVFWLTYFNEIYGEFFERGERKIPVCRIGINGGGFIRLSPSPMETTSSDRAIAEELVGKEAFVDPQSSKIKPIGKFALTFQELRVGSKRRLG